MSMYPEVVGPGHMVILFLVVLTFVLIFTVAASLTFPSVAWKVSPTPPCCEFLTIQLTWALIVASMFLLSEEFMLSFPQTRLFPFSFLLSKDFCVPNTSSHRHLLLRRKLKFCCWICWPLWHVNLTGPRDSQDVCKHHVSVSEDVFGRGYHLSWRTESGRHVWVGATQKSEDLGGEDRGNVNSLFLGGVIFSSYLQTPYPSFLFTLRLSLAALCPRVVRTSSSN